MDALLGEQQRPHDDLDLVIALKDVASVEAVLLRGGYTDKDREAPLSFMAVDSEGRQVDIHPVIFVHSGYELSQKDHDEIHALHDRFDVEPPRGYSWRPA